MEDIKFKLNSEIKELQVRLNKVNEEKEQWFSKKESLKKEVSLLIYEINKIKSSTGKIYSEFEKNKQERDSYNNLVKEQIKNIKGLNQKKSDLVKQYKIKGDPLRVLNIIENLEKKIETEAPSFEKEKEIMKKINALKKHHSQSSELAKILEEYNKISAQIIDYRKKADHFHSLLNDAYSKNKSESKIISELSKKIRLLRKEQEAAFKKFLEFKKEFSNVNNELKIRLLQMNQLRKEENAKKQNKMQQKQQLIKSALDEKIKTIEEKIKSKKKLTTDDFLVFQKNSS